ncbi:MAG: ABC transporter permease, partial [Gammaproteobacteria bacterium]|nr:ABC transporter permease [Gammaproteobacteria bacterium]
ILFLSPPEDAGNQQIDSGQEIRNLMLDLLVLPKVEDVRHIPREQAFDEFKRESGLSGILDRLPNNPLPEILLISTVDNMDAENMRLLIERLERIPLVASVTHDRVWRERFEAVASLFQNISLVIGTIMGLGVLLIAGNTVQTVVQSRSEEVQLLDQLGATSLFIARPFLYYGLIIGIAGALVSLVLVVICLNVFGEPVNRLASLYGSDFRIQPFALTYWSKVIVASGALGWATAGLTVATYIRRLRTNASGR